MAAKKRGKPFPHAAPLFTAKAKPGKRKGK